MSEDLVKAHVKGHMRDGHYVKPYTRNGQTSFPEPHNHPQTDHHGKPVLIKRPHHASAQSTWHSPDAVATFLPGGDVPAEINGVPIRRWKDHPTTDEGWEYDSGIMDDLVEPPIHAKPGKSIGAGVVVEEPDGRVWLCAPTNGFGGYDHTLPKGTAEPGMSLQATALKECFEEAGLRIRITGLVGDFERVTSVARIYRAERVSGDPTACGWESQAMVLCPKGHLYDLMNGHADHPIAEAIGAGPAPKKPEPLPQANKSHFGGLFGKQ